MRLFSILIGLLLLILGWLIPIDGPFDIKPQQVIQQYQKKHPCCAGSVLKPRRQLDAEELEILDQVYNVAPVEETYEDEEYKSYNF